MTQPPPNRLPRRVGGLLGLAWIAVVGIFLFLPIFVIAIYSFNGGRNLYVWTEWSIRWYERALMNQRAVDALGISLLVALLSGVIATVLGFMAGLALARRKGAWVAPFGALLLLVLTVPELVTAIGLMIWFDQTGIYGGVVRLAIGHSLFGAAVVTMIVRARAEGMNEQLEQAAGDLGAPPWRAFCNVTLPLMLPAAIAGFLMAFTLSFDDVIISLFVQRPGTSPFPLYVLSSVRAGLRGDVAALATMTLAASLLVVGLCQVLLARRRN